MKKERIFMLLCSICVVSILAVVLVAACAPAPAPKAEPIKLTAVSYNPLNQVQNDGFMMFIERINKELEGELYIEASGGPEVMDRFEIHEAARTGAIDIGYTACSFYSPIVNKLSEAIQFTNLSEEEIYANTEYYDLMVEVHEKVGLRYLGDAISYVKFFIFTNKRVETPADLAGQKIRTFPAPVPFLKALGAAPVSIPTAEIYTAMERGVVDGYVKDVTGIISDRHYDEVTKYVIRHGFYRGTINILMGLDRWNSLPKHLRDRILEIKTNLNAELMKHYLKKYEDEWKLVEESSIEIIKFSPSDAKAYLDLAYETGWKGIMEADPELGARLKEVLLK